MNRLDEYGYAGLYKALKHKYKFALSTNLPCISRHSQLLALLCIFPELISLQSSSAVSSSLCRRLRSFRLAKRSASSFSFRCLLDSISVDLINAFYLRNRKRVACVYCVIMHAGNVRRIREKHVKHEA